MPEPGCALIRLKPYFASRLFRRVHKIAESLEETGNIAIMAQKPALKLFQLGQSCATPTLTRFGINESPHDLDVRAHGAWASEDAGQHRDALLSENEREMPAQERAGRWCRILRHHHLRLLDRQLEHKVIREAFAIPPHLLAKALRARKEISGMIRRVRFWACGKELLPAAGPCGAIAAGAAPSRCSTYRPEGLRVSHRFGSLQNRLRRNAPLISLPALSRPEGDQWPPAPRNPGPP